MELISGYTFKKRFFSSRGTGKFVMEIPVTIPGALNDVAGFIYEELLPSGAAYGVELENIKGFGLEDNAPLFIVHGEIHVADDVSECNKKLGGSWYFSWHTSYMETRAGTGTLVYKVKRSVHVPEGFPEHLRAALKFSGSIVNSVTFSGECFSSTFLSRLIGQTSVLQFRWFVALDKLKGGQIEFIHFDNATRGDFPVPEHRSREKFVRLVKLVDPSLENKF
jgi:hypothetical protein